ncbi:regulator of ribonuclease-like protein 3 [Hibiscus syriacus]|uniref:Regulator of ribonuclease-like protein 3 n=1 Tax=Hibiscus syriacus TaxID=106335 RepID=A0A6A2WYC2_HIBSY|nr:regulator of ribonuclease-like protein 3 [Hibiscus syriacus]
MPLSCGIDNISEQSLSRNPKSHDKSEDIYLEDIDASSFAFKPIADSNSSFLLRAMSKVNPTCLPQQSFSNTEASVQPESSHPSQMVDPRKLHPQNSTMFNLQADFSRSLMEKDTVGGSVEHSRPLDEPQDEEGDQRVGGEAGGAPYEDRYMFACFKKKVEHSHEGHITEIIYKGAHNHPKPPPNRRSSIGSSNLLSDMQLKLPEQTGLQNGIDGDPVWATAQKGLVAAAKDWTHDNIEMTSSATISPENGNEQAPDTTIYIESGDAVDVSSTFSNDEDEDGPLFSNDEDEDDWETHGSVSLGYDGEGDESESKRRQPVRWISSTMDIGVASCTVMKHVERASHDLKSVITTYEGKHDHDVPAAHNSSHANSATSNAAATAMASSVQPHAHRPEPSQFHNRVRPTSFGPFTLPERQQLVPSPGFSFRMNQPGLANLAMGRLGPGQLKPPILPVHPYMPHQRQSNEMGFGFPKGETKMEPSIEPGLNLSNNTSVYQQLMSRLPLGPHVKL